MSQNIPWLQVIVLAVFVTSFLLQDRHLISFAWIVKRYHFSIVYGGSIFLMIILLMFVPLLTEKSFLLMFIAVYLLKRLIILLEFGSMRHFQQWSIEMLKIVKGGSNEPTE